jgi:hypothetical protein
MDIKPTSNHTTTNIGSMELKYLNKLSRAHNSSNIQYLNAAIHFFRKTGTNPFEPELSANEQLQKLNIRVEQVLKFQRVFESDKLMPLLEKLIIIERRLSQQSGHLTSENLNVSTRLSSDHDILFNIQRIQDAFLPKTEQYLCEILIELQKHEKLKKEIFMALLQLDNENQIANETKLNFYDACS